MVYVVQEQEQDDQGGSRHIYYCKAHNESFTECVLSYIVSMKVCDETDLWLSVFDKEYAEIIGSTAQDLKELRVHNEEEFKNKLANIINLRVELSVKATVSDDGQGPRPKYIVTEVSKINHAKVTKALLQDLELMLGGEKRGGG